jgi:hypothetical protein
MNNIKLPESKIILDLCGGTGAWSKPYKDAGYDVRLITLPEYDVRYYKPPERVYGVLAAPPCTEFTAFCLSRKRDFNGGLDLVMACLNIIHTSLILHYKNNDKNNGGLSGLKFWALENPGGRAYLKYFLGKPAFVFNPFDYGDKWKKETNLWGIFNNPKPMGYQFGIEIAKIRNMSTKKGIDRQVARSITPPGFARAFFEANK